MLRKSAEKTVLEKYRIAAGLTQAELAQIAGVGVNTIGRIETGKIQIRNSAIETGIKLASALNISISDLIKNN